MLTLQTYETDYIRVLQTYKAAIHFSVLHASVFLLGF